MGSQEKIGILGIVATLLAICAAYHIYFLSNPSPAMVIEKPATSTTKPATTVLVTKPVTAPTPTKGGSKTSGKASSPLSGIWALKIGGETIARKEIFTQGDTLKIKYLWLAPRYKGGKCGDIREESDGSFSFVEDYGSIQGVHYLRLVNDYQIEGIQKGVGGKTAKYIMTKQ